MDIVIYLAFLLVGSLLLALAFKYTGLLAIFSILFNLMAATIILSDGGVTQQQDVYNSVNNTWTTYTLPYIPTAVALVPLMFITIVAAMAIVLQFKRR